jgi:hypothetical protein
MEFEVSLKKFGFKTKNVTEDNIKDYYPSVFSCFYLRKNRGTEKEPFYIFGFETIEIKCEKIEKEIVKLLYKKIKPIFNNIPIRIDTRRIYLSSKFLKNKISISFLGKLKFNIIKDISYESKDNQIFYIKELIWDFEEKRFKLPHYIKNDENMDLYAFVKPGMETKKIKKIKEENLIFPKEYLISKKINIENKTEKEIKKIAFKKYCEDIEDFVNNVFLKEQIEKFLKIL